MPDEQASKRAVARDGETPDEPTGGGRAAGDERVAAELALLHATVRAVAEASDVTTAMVDLLRRLCAATGWDYGEAWLPDSEGRQLRDTPVWHTRHPRHDRFQELSRDFSFSKGEGLPGRVWASREPEWLDDLQDGRVFLRADAAARTGLKTGVGLPVLCRGEVVAVFTFFMAERRERDDRAVGLVLSALRPLGPLIRLRRADDAIRGLNRELEARVARRTAELTAANAALEAEIAEHRQAESELRKLTRAVEQSPSAIFVTDLDGNISYVNPAFTRITGYDSADIIGENPRILKSGETPSAVYRDLWRTIRAGEVWRGELVNRRKDGRHYWELLAVAPVLGDDGRTADYIAIQTDITDRKRVDGTLHELYRITTDHSLDLPAQIEALMELGRRHLDLPIATLTRLDGEQCAVEVAIDPLGVVSHGQTCQIEETYCRTTVATTEPIAVDSTAEDDGNLQPEFTTDKHEAFLGVRVVAGDEVLGILGFAGREPRRAAFTAADREIVKLMAVWIGAQLARKQAEDRAREHEAELAHVARLGIMGEMASGLAHELNQPLMAIASYSDACLRMLDAGTVDKAKLEEVIAKTGALAMRGGEIIRRVRRLVSKRPARKSNVQINDLVKEVLGLLGTEIAKRDVVLNLELGDDLPILAVDSIQVEQVLLNIARNGLEAMADGPGKTLSIRTGRDDSDGVEIAISDEGPGLDAEAAQRIFEPFYTSKPDGMGMGLSICRTIVESHRGTLRVDSRSGAGTTLRLVLPLAGADPD